MSVKKLAIHGGQPITNKEWFKWPSATKSDHEAVISALDSNRWSVSGNYSGKETSEESFAKAFSEYHDIRYCIPTSSCTTSIIISMTALGIGKGDEVILPALTWVACATAIMTVGATPILADINPSDLCLSPQCLEAKITSRTKAVLLVHLYANIADLVQIKAICNRHNLYLIEDCAQAHGASVDGKKVGTNGEFGVFSMHQGKVLTSGEGGACITDDPVLYKRAYKSKSNGRLLNTVDPVIGEQQLFEEGHIFSNNYCLSEISSSLLLSRLKLLDEQNRFRFESRNWIEKEIKDFGFSIAKSHLNYRNCRETIYHLPIKLPENLLHKTSTEEFAMATSAEIGFWINLPYPCLSENKLFATIPGSPLYPSEELVVSKSINRQYVLIHHSLLLHSNIELKDLINAFEKVTTYFASC